MELLSNNGTQLIQEWQLQCSKPNHKTFLIHKYWSLHWMSYCVCFSHIISVFTSWTHTVYTSFYLFILHPQKAHIFVSFKKRKVILWLWESEIQWILKLFFHICVEVNLSGINVEWLWQRIESFREKNITRLRRSKCKNWTMVSLSRNHDPVPQDDPQCCEQFLI